MNAPFHSFHMRLFQDGLSGRQPPTPPPAEVFSLPDTGEPTPQYPVESLLSEKIPELVAQPERWGRGAAIAVAIHVLVIATVVLGGLGNIAAEEPPLTVLGEISLGGMGSPGGSGGNGEAGSGSPAKIAEAVAQPAAEPAAEAAQPEEPATPEKVAEEAKKPEVEPQPIVDPKAAQKEKKVEPKKPKAKPRHKLAQKLRSLVAHDATAGQESAPKGPITSATAPENGLGTGTGTGQGDGAGEGNGKGLGHGDGPPGIGGGPGGSGRGYQFGQGDGPRFRHRALPKYPPEARDLNKDGVVTLRLTIDQSGLLRDVTVVRHSGQEFVEEALKAIRSSSFFPAMHQGKAILSRALLTIRFHIS